jgi:hypothetical protein
VRRFVSFGLAIGLASAAIGCGPPPSVRVRWQVVDRNGDVQPTTSAVVCSELGINTVRVRIFDDAGDIADDEYHACFARRFDDPEQTVAGPALDAGPYTVEVRGVQRNLEPWPDIAFREVQLGCAEDQDGDVRCDDAQCECDSFEARDDHTERLLDFIIAAPGECFDGIDNPEVDGPPDGLVDAEDPSCEEDALAIEGRPVTDVQFRLLLTLFGRNAAVSCDAVDLTDVRARLCPRDEGADVAPCTDAPDAAILACRTGTPLFFEQTLEEGDYTLELVGRGVQGIVRTAPQLFPISFGGGAGAVVPIELDFAASTFTPPIDIFAGFELRYASGDGTRGCAPPLGTNEVALTTVRLEILDAHGGPLATPVALALQNGTPLEGPTSPCPSQFVRTEALPWGGYSLRASAMIADGTVCFSTEGTGPGGTDAPLLLAPKDISVVLPPVLDADGTPPDGCD